MYSLNTDSVPRLHYGQNLAEYGCTAAVSLDLFGGVEGLLVHQRAGDKRFDLPFDVCICLMLINIIEMIGDILVEQLASWPYDLS